METRHYAPWILFQLFNLLAATPAAEPPMFSTWKDDDWPKEELPLDEVFTDDYSGCVCRHKIHESTICYGERICKKFPYNITIPFDIYHFGIKNSLIKEILSEDFNNFEYLKTLEIDANNQLHTIAPRSFQMLSNLFNLSISYNTELRRLHPDVFVGLSDLQYLRLLRNGFEKIIDASIALNSQYLPNLISLSLSENSFSSLDDSSFALMNGTNLVELELILCQIENIHEKTFNIFSDLQYLRIGDNLMSEAVLSAVLNQFVSEEIPLKLLNLKNLGFRRDDKLTELLETIAQLNVTQLILRKNHIEAITNGLFPSMPNLSILDLREISAVSVEIGALGPERLPNLKVLLLSGNKLAGITPGLLLPQISMLDLSENSGNENSPSYFHATWSTNLSTMTKLRSLDLSNNTVSTISNITFQGYSNLRSLGLRSATIYFIAKNSFIMLSKLKILNLGSNPYHPFNVFNYSIFEGLGMLETLYLSDCKIKMFAYPQIFAPLTNLKYLNLKGNELTTLNWHLMDPLKMLIGIDLSQNYIRPWALSQRFSNNLQLQIIILNSNRLTTVTATMMDDFKNLSRLDISQNTIVCDCWAFNQTMKWFKAQNISANETCLMSPYHVCSSPRTWRDQLLTSFLDSELDLCYEIGYNSSLYIFIGVLSLLSLALGVSSYIYRWHIRYWIFLARMAFLRRHGWLLKRNKGHTGVYKYDVFVSYSHDDRNFIVKLVAMLENRHPYLKLCVYERDFEIGTVISDTVMEKVSTSRKTLLVVSNSFAKSQWCMWELQLAEYHRLFFRSGKDDNPRGDDPFIIIKLGAIAEANMTPTLKFLMKNRIYLEWNQDPKKQSVFWNRLKSTLAVNISSITPPVV